MKYLCLVYAEQTAMRSLPDAEMQALVDASLAYDDVLRQGGHLVVAQALQPVETARTLRVRKGKLAITDGPFAETKEQLLGFLMIDAGSDAEAVELASKVPMARYGSIEVRSVRGMTRSTQLERRLSDGAA